MRSSLVHLYVVSFTVRSLIFNTAHSLHTDNGKQSFLTSVCNTVSEL